MNNLPSIENLPPVSVVIPIYNHEKYVIQSLRSVLEQTYPSLEIILIDDGSKDQSPLLVEEYLKQYECPPELKREIVFLKEKNKGAHATINHGISLAKHHYLSILNSDDYYSYDRIEVIVNEMLKAGNKIAFSEIAGVDENGQPLSSSHFWTKCYDLDQKHLATLPTVSFGFLYSNFAISTGNFLFTKDLYEEVGPFKPYLHAHDYDFLLRAIQSFEPLFVRKTLYFYRMHSSNTITQNHGITKSELSKMIPDFLINMIASPPKNKLAPSPWNFPTEFAKARHETKIDRFLSKYLKTPNLAPKKELIEFNSLPKRTNSGEKIGLITHALSFTGAPKVVYDLALTLQSKGYRPTIFSLSPGPLKKHFEAQGIPVTIIPEYLQTNKLNSFITKFVGICGLYFYLLTKLPRKVIFNSFASLDAGLPAGYLPFQKRFWFIHESIPPAALLPRAFMNRAMKVLQDPKKFTFLFGSKSTQQLWKRSQINGEVVYWSGLHETEMKELQPRPIKNILAMGSVEMRKGTHTLLEAFIQCIKRKSIEEDVTLTIVGFPEEIDSPYQGDLVLKVLKENLQDRIHLVKVVPVDQVDPYYDQADLFVMASSNECLPLVLLTAMSKGLPIVTTTANGCEEAIENGVSGFTCPPLNPYVLADTLEKAIQDYPKSWQMAHNAQKRFNEKFSLSHNVSKFMEVFESK